MRNMGASILIAAIVLAAACGGSSGPQSPTGDWMPLSVGSEWYYDAEGYMATISGDTFDVIGSVTRTIPSLVPHQQGFNVYTLHTVTELEYVFPDTTIEYRDTAYAYETETEFRGYEDTTGILYETVVRYPINVGNSWKPYPDSLSITREVMSISETVEVPAGSFGNCAFLRDSDSVNPERYTELYLAQDVGPVRHVIHDFYEEDSVTAHVEVDLVTYTE
jgi:hypothetical protein